MLSYADHTMRTKAHLISLYAQSPLSGLRGSLKSVGIDLNPVCMQKHFLEDVL